MTPTLPLTSGYAATRTGPRHPVNEDQFRCLDADHPLVTRLRRGVLYAVADGVSSTPRGRHAAEVGCARIESFYDSFTPPRVESLVQLVSEIDWELREERKGDAACTMSILWLAHGQATVVHVGDSQVYRVRDGDVERITRESKGRGLGAFVGMGPRVADALQIWSEPVHEGDLFVLVTDGVTEVVQPAEILEMWWTCAGSPRRTAEGLIAEVDRRGGSDDATALVVDVLAVDLVVPDEARGAEAVIQATKQG